MSAFGPKQTWRSALHMSAFGGVSGHDDCTAILFAWRYHLTAQRTDKEFTLLGTGLRKYLAGIIKQPEMAPINIDPLFWAAHQIIGCLCHIAVTVNHFVVAPHHHEGRYLDIRRRQIRAEWHRRWRDDPADATAWLDSIAV